MNTPLLHADLDDASLRRLIKKKIICLGGNRRLFIFGSLRCASGRRMKKENRIFFNSAHEAVMNGFRPCSHCLRSAYKIWKDGIVHEEKNN